MNIEKRQRGGLTLSSRIARDTFKRIERAWQSRNAKVERADAEFNAVVQNAGHGPAQDTEETPVDQQDTELHAG
jgi:hypothetical protein